jgi:hypothetical protein
LVNRWLAQHVAAETYVEKYGPRVDNSVYRPIIDELLKLAGLVDEAGEKASEEKEKAAVSPVLPQATRLPARESFWRTAVIASGTSGSGPSVPCVSGAISWAASTVRSLSSEDRRNRTAYRTKRISRSVNSTTTSLGRLTGNEQSGF